METNELKELFAAYDAKLDRALQLNESSLKKIKLDKIQKQTRWISVLRSIEVVSFLILAVILGSFIADNWAVAHLAVSGVILHVFTLIALAGSIGQLVLLQQIDYAKPIVEIRKKNRTGQFTCIVFFKTGISLGADMVGLSLSSAELFFQYRYLSPYGSRFCGTICRGQCFIGFPSSLVFK